MALAPAAALWFLPFVLPICIWVAFNDMKFMKIPNVAVVALFGVFAVVGLVVFPLPDYGWGYVRILVVLAFGFVLNIAGVLGAGDAKFAAAAAGFIPLADLPVLGVLLSAVLLAAFATHRLVRLLPVIRRRYADWASWTRKDFPMGLALGGTLAFYLLLAAFLGL